MFSNAELIQHMGGKRPKYSWLIFDTFWVEPKHQKNYKFRILKNDELAYILYIQKIFFRTTYLLSDLDNKCKLETRNETELLEYLRNDKVF